MLRKGDIILIVCALLAVILGVVGIQLYRNNDNGGHKIAVIKQNNQVIKKFDLDTLQKAEDLTISGDYKNIIIVEQGRIRFKDADCPDKACVKKGWLSQKGDVAVCLPNRAIIEIEGESDKVDGVTY